MSARVLVYGYGNPGRLDDGLGPALVHELAQPDPEASVTLHTAYQLQIEDAALVAEHDVVVFVDADVTCPAPFELRRLVPCRDSGYSTHSVAPEAVLALARQHFGCDTVGFTLGIRGYDFDGYGERLSPRAGRNLAAALELVRRALQSGSLVRAARGVTTGGDLDVRA